ncbi:MAG: class I SAM-dependent methyltransferase [Arenicellales bacterium]
MQRDDAQLSEYYAARAPEYESIYAKPERQRDLAELVRCIGDLLSGRRVLEIACGTGYWTRHLATRARHVVATDLNPETLTVARTKELGPAPVDFRIEDAYRLGDGLGTFDGAFVGFWWSHVPRERVSSFLASLHGRLEQGAVVVVVDNRYVEGSSTPISRWDGRGNSYQIRTLRSGRKYEVLKNFPGDQELRSSLSGMVGTFTCRMLDYYWLVHYDAAA